MVLEAVVEKGISDIGQHCSLCRATVDVAATLNIEVAPGSVKSTA